MTSANLRSNLAAAWVLGHAQTVLAHNQTCRTRRNCSGLRYFVRRCGTARDPKTHAAAIISDNSRLMGQERVLLGRGLGRGDCVSMSRKHEGAGLVRYLKEAFKFRWNLLALAGAAAAAILSPAPDIALPLVAAAEIAYLAGMSAIPKFRAAIDAKDYFENQPQLKAAAKGQATQTLIDMLDGLQNPARNRFEQLRHRCLEMQRIAHGVRGQTTSTKKPDSRTASLDRMLWVFVRLLYSQQALARFLHATDADAIEERIRQLKQDQTEAAEKDDERIVNALVDSLATEELRLLNYQKAESNAKFVDVELNRIEGKIQALTEMTVSHEDPDYISGQVDSVADSMVSTEKAIRELNSITGLSEEWDETPAILDADSTTQTEKVVEGL